MSTLAKTKEMKKKKKKKKKKRRIWLSRIEDGHTRRSKRILVLDKA